MPKDAWGKARNKDIAKRARREYAVSGGHSSFAYAWSDNVPAPTLGARKKKSKAKKANKQVTAKATIQYDPLLPQVRRMVLVSRRIWDKQGQLRPEALKITGEQASLRLLPDGLWAWSLSRTVATGKASSLIEARIEALEVILTKKPCLRDLAKLARYKLK